MCATPIGNLGDASPRLRELLGAVDVIACEDTRVTRKLLGLLDVSPVPRLLSHRQDNERESARGIVQLLEQGKDVALATDAGTPAISDPGVRLVRAAREAGVEVLAVPGPSAVAAALSVSGCGGTGHTFVGFLPRTAREMSHLLVQHMHQVLVAFESPARLAASVRRVAQVQPQRVLSVSRELTKLHEHSMWGEASDVAAALDTGPPPRGEIVLVLDAMPPAAAPVADVRAIELVLAMAKEGVRVKRACQLVAAHAGHSANELFEAVQHTRRNAGD